MTGGKSIDKKYLNFYDPKTKMRVSNLGLD